MRSPRNSPEHIEKLRAAGKIGGKAKNPNKGFGSRTKEELQELSRKAYHAKQARKAETTLRVRSDLHGHTEITESQNQITTRER